MLILRLLCKTIKIYMLILLEIIHRTYRKASIDRNLKLKSSFFPDKKRDNASVIFARSKGDNDIMTDESDVIASME